MQDTVGLFLLSLMKQNRSPKSTGSLAVTRLNSIKALVTAFIVHWHRASRLFVKTGFKELLVPNEVDASLRFQLKGFTLCILQSDCRVCPIDLNLSLFVLFWRRLS